MTNYLLTAALLLTAPEAALARAKNGSVRASSSGSSRMDPGEFVSCVQDAVLGVKDGECVSQPESPACIGLRQALQYSVLKTTCAKVEAAGCKTWSHKGRTQAEWTRIAGGHLALFGNCVRKRYGSVETMGASGTTGSNGFKEAQNDDTLIPFLKQVNDGGKVYGLTDGQLLIRAVQEDRFSRMIQDSPYAKDINAADLFVIGYAADEPFAFRDRVTSAGTSAGSAREGENFSDLARDYMAESAGPSVVQSPDLTAKRAAEKSFLEMARAAGSQAPVMRTNRQPAYSLGLDRTLFERVSSAYQRQSGDLQGVDDYIKALRPTPPRDLSELLRRGGSL